MNRRRVGRYTESQFDGNDLLKVAYLALIIILVLEIVALAMGVDGVMFGIATTGIGTILGWLLKAYTFKRK